MAQLDACPTGDQDIVGLVPLRRQHSFMDIDHEIFSMVILSLLLKKSSYQFLEKECA